MVSRNRRAAHCGWAQFEPSSSTRNTSLGEHCIECDQQIEVRSRHASSLVQFTPGLAPDARIQCNCCVFRHLKYRRKVLVGGR